MLRRSRFVASSALLSAALLSAVLPASAQSDAINPWAKQSGAPPDAPPPAPPPANGGDTVNPWQQAQPPQAPPPTGVNLPPAEPPKAPAKGKKPPPKKPPPPPPRKARKHGRGKAQDNIVIPPGVAIATSPTFLMLDGGGSRVVLEVNRKVAISEHKSEGRIVFRLAGVMVPERVNQLALPLGFFATPVSRIQLTSQGVGADLEIDLRERVNVVHRVIDTQRGIMLQIDLPPPAQQREAPARVEAPRRIGGE